MSPIQSAPSSPGILILAAGTGSRFAAAGGQGHKLMARYADRCGEWRPLLDITLENAAASGLPIHLVTRPDACGLFALARRYNVEMTMLVSDGSGASIAAGVADTPHWKGWIILPADMAWIVPQDYLRIAAALTDSLAQARPVYRGMPGHPVGFAAGWRNKLLALTGDNGARALLTPEHLSKLPGGPHNLRDADLPVG